MVLSKKRKTVFLAGLCILESLLMLTLLFHKNIFMDEAFTIALSGHSYRDVIALTAADVHPPVYYLILKFLTGIFGTSLMAMHLVSFLPFLFQMLLGCTLVRKRFGDRTSFLFLLCLFGMPKMLYYSTDIRMYSWAMFFVTAAALFSYEIILNGRFRNWLFFTIFSLLAAYTHYFACAAVAFLYFYLLIHAFRVNKAALKKWMLCAVFTVIAYLPWLGVVLRQISQVTEEYWIPPITFSTLLTYIEHTFAVKRSHLLSLLLLLVFLAVFCLFLFRKKDRDDWFAAACFSTSIGMVLVGLAASFLIRPVFYQRYMVSSYGCMWLFFAIEARNIRRPFVTRLLTAWLILCSILNFADILELRYQSGVEQMASYMESVLEPGDVIVHTHNGVQKCFAYYFPEQQHELYGSEITDVYQQVYQNYPIGELNTLSQLDQVHGRIWIAADPSHKAILEDFKEAGYQPEYRGIFFFDEYQVLFYSAARSYDTAEN